MWASVPPCPQLISLVCNAIVMPHVAALHAPFRAPVGLNMLELKIQSYTVDMLFPICVSNQSLSYHSYGLCSSTTVSIGLNCLIESDESIFCI